MVAPLASAFSDGMHGEMLLRLGLAVVLGGAVGLEREFHGRAAGLRTHILVCLGATIVMIATAYLHRLAPGAGPGSPLRIDPGRIAAGILTGIGFIGAGAIIRLRGTHRGLTTAACIWLVASIGVVLGVGAYAVALGGTLLALGVLMLLSEIEKALKPDWYREVVVVAELREGMLARVRSVLEDMGMRVLASEYEQSLEQGRLEMTFNVKYRKQHLGDEAGRRLREVPGVLSISWRLVGT